MNSQNSLSLKNPVITSGERYCLVYINVAKWWLCQQAFPISAILTRKLSVNLAPLPFQLKITTKTLLIKRDLPLIALLSFCFRVLLIFLLIIFLKRLLSLICCVQSWLSFILIFFIFIFLFLVLFLLLRLISLLRFFCLLRHCRLR